MSLLRCNADCTVGEQTNFRNRTTFMASGRSYLCHSNRCAALIASAITRSEFMRHEMHAEPWRATPHSAYPKNTLIRLVQKIIAKTFQTAHESVLTHAIKLMRSAPCILQLCNCFLSNCSSHTIFNHRYFPAHLNCFLIVRLSLFFVFCSEA